MPCSLSLASLRNAILLFFIAAIPAFSQPTSDTLERRPRFFGTPPVDCIIQGDPYSYTIGILDSNFFTLPNGDENVTLTMVGPSGFTVTPTSITGPRSNDSVTLAVSSSAINAPVGKLWITLAARDSKGESTRCATTFRSAGGLRF